MRAILSSYCLTNKSYFEEESERVVDAVDVAQDDMHAHYDHNDASHWQSYDDSRLNFRLSEVCSFDYHTENTCHV